jgi:hypothetical protein
MTPKFGLNSVGLYFSPFWYCNIYNSALYFEPRVSKIGGNRPNSAGSKFYNSVDFHRIRPTWSINWLKTDPKIGFGTDRFLLHRRLLKPYLNLRFLVSIIEDIDLK